MTVQDKEKLNPEQKNKTKSFKRAFNKVQDEYYTPSCLVSVLLPFIETFSKDFFNQNKREPIIWCPFDLAESKYVSILQKNGYNVVHSHISEGLDFFAYQPKKWDIAISNPPFSKKIDIFKRFLTFDKPFVMLMNTMAINYQNISKLFASYNPAIQHIFPDKKVSFNGNTSSFSSSYVCYKFIDRTHYVHLENNNAGRFYSSS